MFIIQGGRMSSIEERILKVVRKNMEKKMDFELNQTIKDIGIDSLGMIIILDALEDEFDIEIDKDEILIDGTIQDLINYIKGKVN